MSLDPSEEFVRDWARGNKAEGDLADLRDDSAFRSAVGEAVDRANAGLSQIEKVKRYVIASEAFTVDNGMMTPTMKVRRHEILKHYKTELESLY